jgi:hypothetical protein
MLRRPLRRRMRAVLSAIGLAKAGITLSMRSTKVANTRCDSPRLPKTHGCVQIRAHLLRER